MYKEGDKYIKGEHKAEFYEDRLREAKERRKRLEGMRKVVKAEDMPWEICREGKIKHACNEKMDARVTSFDVYIQEIPAGGRSGKHRHMRDEAFYVLEGRERGVSGGAPPWADRGVWMWAVR